MAWVTEKLRAFWLYAVGRLSIPRWLVWAIIAVAASLLIRCAETGREIPRAFRGQWDTDDITALQRVMMSAKALKLVYDDGDVEQCRVTEVIFHDPLGYDQRFYVYCDLASAPKRLSCDDHPATGWKFEISAAGAGDPYQIELLQIGGCYGSSDEGPLFRHDSD